MQSEKDFWEERYSKDETGWDIGTPSTPIKEYIDQVKNKNLKILVPGAGRAYEAGYLFEQGFKYVTILDIAAQPLQDFQERVPSFPSENLVQGNFFEHTAKYDLILEQTFFCAFEPAEKNRLAYAKKISDLLAPNGKLAGLWFKHSLEKGGPPFGGSKEEYLKYFKPHFHIQTFEDCYNSIPPRAGNELFGIFQKK